MRRALAAVSLAALALAAGAPGAPAAVNVVSLAGDTNGDFADGFGTVARFNGPAGLALDADGNILVADQYNKRIRRVTPAGEVTTIAGNSEGNADDGLGTAASFNNPHGVEAGPFGQIFVADYQNGLLRRIDSAGYVTRVPGGFYNQPRDVAVGRDGVLYVAEGSSGWVERVIPSTGARRVLATGLREPMGIAVDARNNLYVSDFGSQQIVKILPTGRRFVLAGQGNYGVQDGATGVATFGRPAGVALDAAGCVYVADIATHRIRRVTPYGYVQTLAGGHEGFDEGPGHLARFDGPIGIVPAPGGIVYVGDSHNQRIRKLSGVTPCPAGLPTRRIALSRASMLASGVFASCGTNQPATCSWTLTVAGRRAGYARTFVSYSGRKGFRVRLSPFGRALLAARRPATVVLRGYVGDAAGTRLVFQQISLVR